MSFGIIPESRSSCPGIPTPLQDFLSMMPQTYSLHAPEPYIAFMKGKTVCSEDGEEIRRWATAHKIAEQVERTAEVYWVRKRKGESELWLRRN
jgi:hypothetical protein